MGVVHSQATATILSGQTVGVAFYVGAKAPISLRMPTTAQGFTGTTMTFQGSFDNVLYQAINQGGGAYTETVAVDKDIALDQSALAGFPYLKLVSGSAEAADRSVVVTTRAVK